jgi:plastocyanin
LKITKRILGLAAAGLAAVVTAVYAAEHVVGQKNKDFTQKSLRIKVGDSVDFRNDDAFFHNVFSLSDAKTFDLGSYPQGQSRKVTFDKAGVVDVECSIHPNMKMTIEVAK